MILACSYYGVKKSDWTLVTYLFGSLFCSYTIRICILQRLDVFWFFLHTCQEHIVRGNIGNSWWMWYLETTGYIIAAKWLTENVMSVAWIILRLLNVSIVALRY